MTTWPDPFASARAVREAIVSGATTALSVCDAAIARIEASQDRLRAFLHVDAAGARERARLLDCGGGSAGPLHGVPVALKDNIVKRAFPTSAGSRILEGYRAPYDATVVERLEAAGAVIVGTTTCDEFAMGSSTENCAFGPARNPSATDRALEARAADWPRPWPRVSCRWRSGPTPAGRCASPHRSVV